MNLRSNTTTLPLLGPRADNPLGFLASVGTLRVLSIAWPDREVRMSWEDTGETWQPVLHIQVECTKKQIVDALDGQLRGRQHAPEFRLSFRSDRAFDDLAVTPKEFADFAAEAAERATATDHTTADFCAAFGTDLLSDGKQILDTAFRTMSGAGHQHFLKSMRELAEQTTKDDLFNALFKPWEYDSERPTMRWDPVDDRRYALRAFDPADSSRSPIRTVRGANRLAIEALPCLPTAPNANRLHTTAFFENRSGAYFSWPVWNVRLSVDAVKSLLAHRELMDPEPRPGQLEPLGVVEVFRSRRLTTGRFRNFTPPIAVWGA